MTKKGNLTVLAQILPAEGHGPALISLTASWRKLSMGSLPIIKAVPPPPTHTHKHTGHTDPRCSIKSRDRLSYYQLSLGWTIQLPATTRPLVDSRLDAGCVCFAHVSHKHYQGCQLSEGFPVASASTSSSGSLSELLPPCQSLSAPL